MRLLDILVATLVLLPWLTEGIGFSLPGIGYVDLPDLGIPLLAAGLVVVAVRTHWGMREVRAMARAAAAVAAVFGLVLAWRYWAYPLDTLNLGGVLWSLSHDTGGALVVAAVALALRPWSQEPWEKSFLVRQAAKLASAWRAALERAPALALWSAAGLVGALLLWVALLRHWALDSHGFDLGIFTNAMWNLTHGQGYVSSVKGGINLFSDHQSPIFWLLAPIFWLAPRPETLLAVQAFGLAAGGPALYYLGRAHFGRAHWASAALPWLYWAYLPLRNANAFDFHPEVFMLPLFLWAFAALRSERRWARALGIAALAAALGAKESAPVVAVGIGFAWALTSGPGRARWPGIALIAAGLAVFLFDVKVVPRFFGEDYAYLNLYERFGGGIGDLLLAPFTQPAYFFSQLLSRERLSFLFWTLAPLGFLPLFDWRAALAAVPAYLMLFLSEGDQRVRIVFHYGIEPGSALFWALPFGLAAFAARFGWRVAGIWLLFWSVAAFGPSEFARARSYSPTPYAQWFRGEVLPCLDREAATAASDVLIPHLAARSWVSYPDQLEQRPSAEPVRCVVTDVRLENWPLGSYGVSEVLAGLPERGYREAFRCGGFSIYELATTQCLRCRPQCR